MSDPTGLNGNKGRMRLPGWAIGFLIAVGVDVVLVGLALLAQPEAYAWNDQCLQRYYEDCLDESSDCPESRSTSQCQLPIALLTAFHTGPSPWFLTILVELSPGLSKLYQQYYELQPQFMALWFPAIVSLLGYSLGGALLYAKFRRRTATILLCAVFLGSVSAATSFWMLLWYTG